MNIFKRVSDVEDLMKDVVDLQGKESKLLRMLYDKVSVTDRELRIFQVGDRKCVVDRVDFSGGDAEHYALVLFIDSERPAYSTYRMQILQPTTETIKQSKLFSWLARQSNVETVPEENWPERERYIDDRQREVEAEN